MVINVVSIGYQFYKYNKETLHPKKSLLPAVRLFGKPVIIDRNSLNSFIMEDAVLDHQLYKEFAVYHGRACMEQGSVIW
jgi:hypothetical protein